MYLFIFLAVLSDVFLIILYTRTGSAIFAKILLYGTETIIMIIFAYLLLKTFGTRLPVFIYIYIGYILLMMLVSFLYYDGYTVLKDSRKFLAPIPPLLLGYYFTLAYKEEREKYVTKLITFLTVMSVIGLIEWVWWYFSYDSIVQLYSKYFDIGSYYHYIRQTSNIEASGIMTSGIRPAGFLIPGVTKRLTGLYLEPFSAGFNSILAVILILYSRIAGYQIKRRNYHIFLIINIAAVILTTSRSAYLFLFVSLFIYIMIRRRFFIVLPFGLLVFFFYGPLKDFFITLVNTLKGGPHREAVFLFINYFFNYLLSFDGLFGQGIGSRWLGIGEEKALLYIESGYGAIFGQLGLFGLFSIFFLFLTIIARVYFSKENKFFVLSTSISTAALLFFGGYPFGYKTYGLIYLFLGSIMGKLSYVDRSLGYKALNKAEKL